MFLLHNVIIGKFLKYIESIVGLHGSACGLVNCCLISCFCVIDYANLKSRGAFSRWINLNMLTSSCIKANFQSAEFSERAEF